MRRGRMTLAAVLALSQGISSLAAATDPPRGDPQRGARFYADNCGRCHNPRPAWEHRDRDWSMVMTHMRVLAGLPGDQARDIEAFLSAGNRPPIAVQAASVPPPAALSGEAAIENHACRACHVIGGKGGALGPSLDDVFERRDEDWVRVQLRQPRSHNPTTVMPDPGLSDTEVDAIVELLRGSP